MQKCLSFVSLAAALVAFSPASAADLTPEQKKKLLTSANFDAWRSWKGTEQHGWVDIRDGKVRHLNVKPAPVVGTASFEGDNLVLSFSNHRKFGNGKAVLRKVANGQWEGEITMSAGGTAAFKLKRR